MSKPGPTLSSSSSSSGSGSAPAKGLDSITEKGTTETVVATGNDVDDVDPAAIPLRDLSIPILLCFITSFSGFIFGWDVGTIGGISNFESFKSKFAPQNSAGEYVFNEFVIGVIIAIFNLACAIGGLTLSKTADFKGRKVGISVSVVIYIIGAIIQSTSTLSGSWPQFFVGRFFTGFGVGSTSVIAPMFISESAPLKIRGAMVVLYQLMITLGILLGNVTNFACHEHYNGKTAEWLIPIVLSNLFGLLVLVGVCFMPESPAYKVSKGDIEGAKTSFGRLNRLPVTSRFVIREINNLVENKETIELQSGQSKWYEFLTGKPKLLQRTLIGCVLMISQQFSGCNYFFYYGTTIFKSVGLENPYVTAMILGGVNFAFTPLGAYLVERFGRKTCLISGSALMCICMIVYSTLGVTCLHVDESLLGESKKVKAAGGAMIFFTCVYIIGFATTWGPVTFVVVSELYPVRVRAMSMAVATSCNWISNFLISFFSPMIIRSINYKYGYVFAGCLLFSGLFVHFCVPETKGLRIEDVDAHFAESTEDEEARV